MEIFKFSFVLFSFAHVCYSMKIYTEVKKLSGGKDNNVAITDKFVVVGVTDFDESGKSNIGSVSVFKRAGNVVNNPGTTIVPSDGNSGDEFGQAVALNHGYLVVAAKNAGKKAAIYVYRLDAGYTFVQKFLPYTAKIRQNMWFDIQVRISDQNYIIIGIADADGGKGAAYVYSFNGNKWAYQQKLQPSDLKENDRFGHQISVSNDKLAVASYNYNGWHTGRQGNVYMFTIGQQVYEQKLSAPNTPKCGGFGAKTIQVQGNRLIVGADCDAYAFIYETRDGKAWQYNALLDGTMIQKNFGKMVALFNDVAVVSAENYAYNGMEEVGIVIVFQLDRGNNNWVEIGRLGESDADENNEFGREVLRINGNIIVTGDKREKFVYIHDISSLVRKYVPFSPQ